MSKPPGESKVAVFRWFVVRLVTIHNQLDSKYQGDEYFVERLLTEVYIP